MVQCGINFEQNPLGIFYSGSVINGKVEVILENPMDVRSLCLIVSGAADVYWTESEDEGTGDDKRSTSVSYTANETYFNTVTYLYGSSQGELVTVSTGAHLYSFSCLLPPQLPSSLESNNGHIRYSAKVVFDRPWKFDKTFTLGFTVLKIADLNYEDPTIRLPAMLLVQKQFWCWPCATQPLFVQATIPQTGYVSGQNISVTINLYNKSSKEIHHVGVSLKKIVKCTSTHPTTKSKTETITVKKLILGSIQNQPEKEMHVNLLIPPVPSSSSEISCRIIQVNYELRVKAFVEGLHRNPVVIIPIIIGNIPLHSFKTVMPCNIPSTSTADAAPSANSPEICSADFGLPPPTYEEALYIEKINLNATEKHPIAESNFLPRYPVFHFENSGLTPTQEISK